MNRKKVNNRLLYQDRLSVSRYTVTENEDGSNNRELLTVPELTNIPCRLDIDKEDDPVQEEHVTEIKIVCTIFAGPEHALIAGDRLEVMHRGKLYSLTIGDPVLYLHHQEIPAIGKRLA